MKRLGALICAGLVLEGCNVVGPAAGTVSAVVSGSYTGNPAVGAAVGIAVNAGVNAVNRGVARHWRRDEQNAIAEAAGDLGVGQIASWSVHHPAGLSDANGRILVVRELPNALAPCREAVFSIETDQKYEGVYTVLVCRNDGTWTWASAEPAVNRWGSLQ